MITEVLVVLFISNIVTQNQILILALIRYQLLSLFFSESKDESDDSESVFINQCL